MTAAEAEVMQRHVAYWTGFVAQLRSIQEQDPALGIGARYETLPMPRAIFGKAPT
jgi:hypothetical protein